MSKERRAIPRRRSRLRRGKGRHMRSPPTSSCREPHALQLSEETRSASDPFQIGAAAFEEWVDGEAVSFDALDFDDLVDLAGEEALLAAFVGGGAGAVDDDVDLA